MQKPGTAFFAGLVLGIVLLPAFAFLYLRFGYAPVATAAPPLPLEKAVTRMALNARIAPLPASAAEILREPLPAE